MLSECEKAIRYTLPAVRIAVASELVTRHGFTQAGVSKVLGVAQADVSKYLNGRVSATVTRLAKSVERSGMHSKIARLALSGDASKVRKRIDELASSETIISDAMQALKARALRQ